MLSSNVVAELAAAGTNYMFLPAAGIILRLCVTRIVATFTIYSCFQPSIENEFIIRNNHYLDCLGPF
jgi:hypothetical protein